MPLYECEVEEKETSNLHKLSNRVDFELSRLHGFLLSALYTLNTRQTDHYSDTAPV